MNAKKELKIQRIRQGVVIDHITAGKWVEILKVLGMDSGDYKEGLLTIGANYDTSKLVNGKKDIIKIENRILTSGELNKIALVDNYADIYLINNWKKKAISVEIPDSIEGILLCYKKKDCISAAEGQHHNTSIFEVLTKKPLTLQCMYCGSRYTRKDIKFA